MTGRSNGATMQGRRKVFRIEAMNGKAGRNGAGKGDPFHTEIMAELKALRAVVEPQESVTQQMIEACNFQDLTGQRIAKVVATLKFIESHIARMIDIWGGLESFKDVTPEAIAAREGERALLNGPRLKDETGHAGQDEIDALFA